ncbi:MAG: hypothetical protein ACLTF5_02605 [Butyricicoccus sp.]
MLKKIQQDFSYYSHEFKDNYRKAYTACAPSLPAGHRRRRS